MASIGQSIGSTRNRNSDRPDPASEKRELRRMVQELEAENERLREALAEIAAGLPGEVGQLGSGFEDHYHAMRSRAEDALDGGGEADD